MNYKLEKMETLEVESYGKIIDAVEKLQEDLEDLISGGPNVRKRHVS